VNWIKYYDYTPGKGENGSDFTEQWTDNFDTFDASRWSKANWTFDVNLVDFSPDNVVVKDGYLVLVISHVGKPGFSGTVPKDSE
jgi:endo-1,3-1,4-beta-glycanase ExoK